MEAFFPKGRLEMFLQKSRKKKSAKAPNSCRGWAVRALDFHTGGPRFEPWPGSSALGQGALSSLPSLSEETLSPRSRV